MRTARLLSILGLAALASTGGSVLAMPAPQRSGGVQYVSGGIGADESHDMQAAASQWPLALEFAVRSGNLAQWLANVDVRIADRHGREVLHTLSDGPLLFAQLAPGDYTIRADADGRAIERHVHIGPGGHAKLTLVWPAGTDVALR